MPAAQILPATRAQLGAANVPGKHVGTQAVDPREAPVQAATAPDQPAAGHRWRPAPRTTLAPEGEPTLTGSQLPSHEVPGFWGGTLEPDPRNVYGSPGKPAGYPQTIPAASASVELTNNTRERDRVVTEGLISGRPRAGFTSADGTRPATMPHWLFMRPFDKLMSSSLGAAGKVIIGLPRASRPFYAAHAVDGAVASPMGGGAADGMRALGRFGLPNTVRVLPDPWDANVLNNGPVPSAQVPDPAAVAAAGARVAGWRAR